MLSTVLSFSYFSLCSSCCCTFLPSSPPSIPSSYFSRSRELLLLRLPSFLPPSLLPPLLCLHAFLPSNLTLSSHLFTFLHLFEEMLPLLRQIPLVFLWPLLCPPIFFPLSYSLLWMLLCPPFLPSFLPLSLSFFSSSFSINHYSRRSLTSPFFLAG